MAGRDTHRNQAGAIAQPLSREPRIILPTQVQMGPQVWARTPIYCHDRIWPDCAAEWDGRSMRGLFGLDRGVLDRTVFPGLDMRRDPKLIL